MTSLHDAVADYLRIRRAAGIQFRKVGPALEHFVEFLEQRGAERVTVELAVEWATLATAASDTHRANRLTMVRGFAAYLRERDPANEIPPWGSLPSGKPRTERPRRRRLDTAPDGVRAALADYLRIRRALGYKLTKDERALRNFVAFLERAARPGSPPSWRSTGRPCPRTPAGIAREPADDRPPVRALSARRSTPRAKCHRAGCCGPPIGAPRHTSTRPTVDRRADGRRRER